MSNSLKDQLVALGLGKTEKRKKADREISLNEAWRRKAQNEKKSVEDKRRKKMEQDRLRRQINASIKPIIDQHKLNDPKAELKRNFLYKGRIRSVLVTAEQLQALNDGLLGLVFLRGSYFLLEPEHVQKVRDISEEHVPDLSGGGDQDEDEEHPVPDDLVW